MERRIEEARLLLLSLGASPGAVAASLRKAGACGLPLDCAWCPLARFLQARTGLCWRVSDFGAWIADGSEGTLRLPPACAAFMERFDAGEEPALRLWR